MSMCTGLLRCVLCRQSFVTYVCDESATTPSMTAAGETSPTIYVSWFCKCFVAAAAAAVVVAVVFNINLYRCKLLIHVVSMIIVRSI